MWAKAFTLIPNWRKKLRTYGTLNLEYFFLPIYCSYGALNLIWFGFEPHRGYILVGMRKLIILRAVGTKLALGIAADTGPRA